MYNLSFHEKLPFHLLLSNLDFDKIVMFQLFFFFQSKLLFDPQMYYSRMCSIRQTSGETGPETSHTTGGVWDILLPVCYNYVSKVDYS